MFYKCAQWSSEAESEAQKVVVMAVTPSEIMTLQW